MHPQRKAATYMIFQALHLLWGFFMSKIWQGIAMCELSNEQVFSNWQECNRENRQQGADYWHDFMSKRAKRGYKGAQAVVDKMDRLK